MVLTNYIYLITWLRRFASRDSTAHQYSSALAISVNKFSSSGRAMKICFALSLLLACACAFPSHGLDHGQGIILPPSVDIYAKTDIGSGQRCMTGARADDDGMNGKPVAYLGNSRGAMAWHVTLPLPSNTYQARATHCAGTPSTLYVLVQGDTQSEQSLSQTLLEVVAINRSTGVVTASKPVDVPNIKATHTTWVEAGSSHFLARGGNLVITGKYALLSDRDKPLDFSLQVAQGLNP